jgi:hypothetical protein
MTDEQRKPGLLARRREKQRLKRHRTVMDRLFGGADEDSEEKLAQRYTNRGRELEAKDAAMRPKGGGDFGGGGGAGGM